MAEAPVGCALFRVSGLLDHCLLLYHTSIWWRVAFAGFLGERCLNQDFKDKRIVRITDDGPILVPWIYFEIFLAERLLLPTPIQKTFKFVD